MVKKIKIKLQLFLIGIKRFGGYLNYITYVISIEEYNQIERLLDDEYYNLINEYKKLNN